MFIRSNLLIYLLQKMGKESRFNDTQYHLRVTVQSLELLMLTVLLLLRNSTDIVQTFRFHNATVHFPTPKTYEMSKHQTINYVRT